MITTVLRGRNETDALKTSIIVVPGGAPAFAARTS
jgi:hypothetical protein